MKPVRYYVEALARPPFMDNVKCPWTHVSRVDPDDGTPVYDGPSVYGIFRSDRNSEPVALAFDRDDAEALVNHLRVSA